MIDLHRLAAERGYRITVDETATIDQARSSRPWLYRIPCRYGFISVHGPTTLAAWTGNPKMVGKLISVPGVHVHQRGDTEARVLFAQALPSRRRRRNPETPEASPSSPHRCGAECPIRAGLDEIPIDRATWRSPFAFSGHGLSLPPIPTQGRESECSC